MDNNAAQINIIKPEGGAKLRLPKLSPLVIILVTVLLAVVTAASVFLLYQKRNQPIAPTAAPSANASTTQTVNDNFDSPALDSTKWTTGGSAVGATIAIVNNKLSISFPDQSSSTNSFVRSSQAYTGDFTAEVDVDPVTSTGTGTAGLAFVAADGAPIARVSRTQAGVIEGAIGSSAPTTVILPDNRQVRVKMQRVSDFFQVFYTTDGSTFQLITSDNNGTADGYIELVTTTFSPFTAVQSTYDNFGAQVNFAAVQPTPVPGSETACALSFTVLDTVPTSTPGPSATPSPTSTPTPGPTLTPTPQPTPASCNNTCSTNADCSSGLTCSGNVCRNPQCTTQTNCVCSVATPTPTTAVALGPTPTPVTLQSAGSMTGTLMLGLGGALILGLGAILMFVL